ncbi:MAG: phosphate signaling complex protein PhoU [Thermoplasmata archaeon]|nr:phosphate signaling complex protein PhoU [Thermoplasmata archaeon]
MTEKFQEAISELKTRTMEMAALSIEMLKQSVEALKDRDVERAEYVLSRKRELAQLDMEIEAEAIRLIALYQPVAGDVRKIACVLKLITYLNRIGRYGKDIAKISIELSQKEHIARLVDIPRMADEAIAMVDDAIEAFHREDIAPLAGFGERDDSLDAERYSIYRECLTYMMEDPALITRCTQYIMIARYLERCGDLACKMAEKIHFMVTGDFIEIK